MRQVKLYQDPLYGAKVLSPLAVAVIDTPEFQRLAGLRQLGFSEIVYRGAHHTRFEHSVGTYFMSRTMMRRLVQNHERLGLDHPGEVLPDLFHEVPKNSKRTPQDITFQSKWRGLTEVVSVAALLHDIGHVPFGHTLEDEFTGYFPRHDSLANPRLYTMLFHSESELAAVFDDGTEPWVGRIPNTTLRRLLYVILNWQEDVDPAGDRTAGAKSFDAILKEKLAESEATSQHRERLHTLRAWYSDLIESGLFHPFMSDIIGTTICADLLDYLPRDRTYLGMEAHHHTRLQRYFTIRPGALYPPEEGLRMSIMVTRGAHGGQRRDVATAVLDIMRERYEMAERVYYHHKKAAASAMLAKLVELAPSALRPVDDEAIYPAPWGMNKTSASHPPQMVHLSDVGLIEYLGKVRVASTAVFLQQRLYAALVYRRRGLYRTLLVLDHDLGNKGARTHNTIANELRDDPRHRSSIEAKLSLAANGADGDVIIYCPSASMQSKEVDARMEITEDRILPLRFLDEEFTYRAEVQLLKDYYTRLWRAYIFVTPELYADAKQCQQVVNAFCTEFGLPAAAAYSKVRGHKFPGSYSATTVEHKPYRADRVATVVEQMRAALGDRSRMMSDAEVLQTFAKENNLEAATYLPQKVPRAKVIDFERTLLSTIRSVYPGQKASQNALKWIKRQPKLNDPVISSSFLQRLEAAVEHTPKDLWAARGVTKFVDEDVPVLLDACLSIAGNLDTESEPTDGEIEG